MQRNEIESEINACKNILDNTDYKILRGIEDIFAANGISELLNALTSAGKEIVETIRLRKQCRTRINELEATTPEDEQEEPPVEEEPAVEAEGDAE